MGADGKMLPLLRGVSGAFRPGVLTALMGASGAGKVSHYAICTACHAVWLALMSASCSVRAGKDFCRAHCVS